jgi:hypothetical protein
MARPIKNNADYFSHDNDMRDDERIKAVRRRFSHLGYSTWNMLLERLCRAENFRIEYNDDSVDIMAGDFNIEPEQLTEIIDYLIKLKLIIQDKEIIYSQTMINRFEGLFRKRKRDVERLSVTTTTNEPIIADDNTQSKVKDSKVNKRKENEIKEKGSKENQPPIFFKGFSFSENKIMENDMSIDKTTIPTEKEKSCAKKEIAICKTLFENFAPQYVWESKDNEQLQILINKIKITKQDIQNENQLADAFLSFIQKLPEYWRTKKFTIPNLCNNYNEIVSEIRANNLSGKTKKQAPTYKPIIQKPPEPKREPTAEEKIQMRKDFIKSICETFEKYVNTGEYGFLPLWIMYDTLVEEKILKLPDKKLERFKSLAIATRKAELQKPKHAHEARSFNNILENFDTEITTGNEKNKIDTAVKILAVKGLFEDLKKKQIEIKTLFKN